MCGDMDEDESREQETYARFVAHVHSLLATLKASGKGKQPDAMHAHLDNLFRGLLLTSADHTKTPDDFSDYQRIAMEPLVFARLAGFMAAHLPLQEDPLRRVMEAMMTGYAEGEIHVPEHDHDHDHDHDHPHGHGHGHTH